MTLIVMGHEVYSHTEDRFGDEDGVFQMGPRAIQGREGIFAVADSALTARRVADDSAKTVSYKTLLTGIKKVFVLPIIVYRPDLSPSGCFTGRFVDEVYKGEVLLAFAGRANVAQHALDIIRSHLEKLRLTYNSTGAGGVRGCAIMRDCQKNPMEKDGAEFDDDLFDQSATEHLFTSDYFSSVIEHSINTALKTAVSYCESTQDLDDIRIGFAAGFWCAATKKYKKYKFEMNDDKLPGGKIRAFVSCTEVDELEVIVLGMDYVVNAQVAFTQAYLAGESPAEHMKDLIKSAVNNKGGYSGLPIDLPLVKYKLSRFNVDKSVHQ